MSKPPSETRVLLLILGVIGLMSCGCLCVPLGLVGLGVGLPAAVQVQKTVNRVAEEQARMAVQQQPPPIFEPQTLPELSPEFQPTPPELPQFAPPIVPPPAPQSPPPAKGLASLSETRKRIIHQSATIHRSVLEMLEKQRAEMLQRGQSTEFFDHTLEQTKARLKEQLDRLCQSNNLTRAELEQLIAEGDQQGWSGRSATKKKK